jgi:hypothetical protein
LQPGQTRQIRAAYRLVPMNGMQNKVSIDFTRCFARCDTAALSVRLILQVRFRRHF